LKGWMRRIFVTTTLDLLRKDYFGLNTDLFDYIEKVETVETSAVEKLSAEDILRCISELPKGCRLVFNMHAIEGYSHFEIAKMLNIKEGTSRSQFAYAKQLLQEKIQKIDTHTYKKSKYG